MIVNLFHRLQHELLKSPRQAFLISTILTKNIWKPKELNDVDSFFAATFTICFDEHPLLDKIDFSIESGERVCLIGRNGEGKSTLLKIIAGEILPDHGERSIRQRLKISRLVQEVPAEMAGIVTDIIRTAFLPGEHYEDYQVSTMISRLSLDPEAEFSSLLVD